MEVIDEKKYFAKKEEMLQFVSQNQDKYKRFFLPLLDAIICDIALEDQDNNGMLLRQLLSKFNIYKEGYDEYRIIAETLEQYGFLNSNCCEIGAGWYPSLSELVAPKIKASGHHLTIYEPKIAFTDIDATIVRKKLKKRTNISNIDTLFALYPCNATITMAEKAHMEDKNLFLAFCGCNHETLKYPYHSGDYWAESFCNDYQLKYKNEVEIIKWPSYLENYLPIMVRKSSKQLTKSR